MKQLYFILLTTTFICTSALSTAVAQQETPYPIEHRTPQSYKDFRFAIGGGYAFRLGKTQDAGDAKLNKLNRQLRHGFTVDADAQYFFKESWGIGLNANYCSAKASDNNITLPNTAQSVNYKETQGLLYFGPSLVGRNETSKFLLVTNFGIGPLFFNSDMNISGINKNGTQTTIGINAGIAGEYKVSSKTGIGVKLSYVLGNINSINVDGTNIKSNEKMSVSNLIFTAFISFRSW